VKLYSELGQGTTVKIYLPRHHTMATIQEQEAAPKPPHGSHGEMILVVEDDDDVRAYTTSLLSELGYSIVEAADARSALDILAKTSEITALFTDVGLPGGMNGRQLADEARRRRPDLRVLFTTGYARNAIVHDGRLDPGVQLITKPFTYAALAARLRDVLDAPAATGRILVVEDEVLLQMLAVETLEDVGLQVEVSGTGTDALNKLRLQPQGFEAAVVDIGLPDRKGPSLVSEMRALHAGMPIIVASGQDFAELRRTFGSDPKISILPKPYTTEALIATLQGLGVHVPREPQ
jgi:CheY-like chemotaxis protein